MILNRGWYDSYTFSENSDEKTMMKSLWSFDVSFNQKLSIISFPTKWWTYIKNLFEFLKKKLIGWWYSFKVLDLCLPWICMELDFVFSLWSSRAGILCSRTRKLNRNRLNWSMSEVQNQKLSLWNPFWFIEFCNRTLECTQCI